jgi:hypothetical protein
VETPNRWTVHGKWFERTGISIRAISADSWYRAMPRAMIHNTARGQ